MALATLRVTGQRLRCTAARTFTSGLSLGILIAGAAIAVAISAGPIKVVALALVSGAFLVAVLVCPVIGLVAIGALLPYGSLFALPVAGSNLDDLLVVVVLAAWVLQGLAGRSFYLRPLKLLWPILLFLWFTALSLTQAVSWREGLPEWLKWVELLVVYVLAAHLADGRSWRWVLGAMLVAVSSQAALGLWQFAGRLGPDPFAIMGRFTRAYGTFRQPNPFAGYLGYATPVAFSLTVAALLHGWRGERNSRRGMLWVAVVLGCTSIVGVGGIVASWSRGAWLGLAAGLGVVAMAFAVRSRRTVFFVLIAVTILAGITVTHGSDWLPASIGERISGLGSYFGISDPSRTEITDANFSVLERLAHWQAGIEMFEEHPWTGVGIGNYAVAYSTYAQPHWYDALGHAHNVYLNMLAETGLLGFAGFVLLWLAIAIQAIRVALRRAGWIRAVAIGVLGAWAFVSVQNIFDNLFVQHMHLQLALLLGLVESRWVDSQ